MAVEKVSAAPIEELNAATGREFPGGKLALKDLYTVPFSITAELGETAMKVRDVLALKVGSLVILDKIAGQMADVSINGLPMAKGEVVVIGESLHIRIADVAAGSDEAGGARA